MAREAANIVINATDRASRTLRGVSKRVGKLRNQVFELTTTTSSAIHVMRSMGQVTRALGQAAAVPIRAAIEQEKVEKQLEAVLRSTGEAAGLSQRQLLDMARSFQEVTAFGDEAVIGLQNVLLTFTSIGGAGGIFERTTETALDMAQALGTDLKAQAIQLGKALNDPVAGISALSRVGVAFTYEQKETIRSFVELNDVASAQTVILDELAKEFGGSARAAVETFGGALAQLENAWGDVLERVGEFITRNAGVRALIQEVTDTISDMDGRLAELQGSQEGQVQVAETVRVAMIGVLQAISAVTMAFGAMADGIIELVRWIAEWRDIQIPFNAAQREWAKEIEDTTRRIGYYGDEVERIRDVIRNGGDTKEAQADLRKMTAELDRQEAILEHLKREFHAAGESTISFGEAAGGAASMIEELIQRLQEVDVAAEIAKEHAVSWTAELIGGIEAGIEKVAELHAAMGASSPAEAAGTGMVAGVIEAVQSGADFLAEAWREPGYQAGLVVAEELGRALAEEERFREALALPVSAGFASAFASLLDGEAGDTFSQFTETLQDQMRKALTDPIFGAESAFQEVFKAALTPVRQLGQAIGREVFGPLAGKLKGLFSQLISEEATMIAAQEALHKGQMASQLAVAQAFVASLMPSLSASAALALISTFGGAGASAQLLPGLIAQAKATGSAGAAVPFAQGGLVTGPTFALIGEDGDEAILPLSKPARTRDVLEEALDRLPGTRRAAGGQQIFIEQTFVVGDADPEETAEQVARSLDFTLGELLGRA